MELKLNQRIPVAFADGIRMVTLDQKTMETTTNFFERGNDGVFYFSPKKQRAWINKKTRQSMRAYEAKHGKS